MLFFFRFEYHMFYVSYPFVTYVLTFPLSYTNYVNMDTACSRLQKQRISTFGFECLVPEGTNGCRNII
jgi:hypothetical protein